MLRTCPKCGHDIELLGRIEVGHLTIEDDGASVMWRGQQIKLTKAHRLILRAMAGSPGYIMTVGALITAVDSEANGPESLIRVWINRIRAQFRLIDDNFNEIESVWGVGYRWRRNKL